MVYKKIRLKPIAQSEITSESDYLNRRNFIKAGAAATTLFGMSAQALIEGEKLPAKRNASYQSSDDPQELTDYEKATSYNNFYELGVDKGDPKRNQRLLKTKPWTVELSGEVESPITIDMETILKKLTLEERIYRLRCVETWSMVIPWIGFPLSELLRMAKPMSGAKYVRFESIYAPDSLPMQQTKLLNWPYVEGLRMDEAMNPLTFIAVGLYGKIIPNQNGAPLRLLVPWKYGFKSAKSIVKITFVKNEPVSSWTQSAANEYGFFANVNPKVDHPRWSQAKERRLGEFFKRDTELFNGYGEFVSGMYEGMDLNKFF